MKLYYETADIPEDLKERKWCHKSVKSSYAL